MNTYRYPDKNDTITGKLIQQEESYQGYWAQSEQRILRIIAKHVAPKAGGAFLDVGCGEGRLFNEFQAHFPIIEAIEPDAERYQVARANLNGRADVRLLHTTFETYETERQFDFVLCSHVLQHIPLENIHPFICKLARLTRSGGVAALLTCHSTTGQEEFVVSTCNEEGIVEERPIAANDFNRYVSALGFLPVHFFTIEQLRGWCEEAGFEVLETEVFHILDEAVNDVSFDDKVNASPEWQARYGRDLFFMLRKQ